MSTPRLDPVPLPTAGIQAGFRRWTLQEYHALAEMGLLTEDDNLELIEGYLVHKMTRKPPHDDVLADLLDWLVKHCPSGWRVRPQCAITLSDSEPEPDFAVVVDGPRRYRQRHPQPEDIGLVIEVSDSSLEIDRTDKARIYARAGLPVYWIVNLVDGQIEVYTTPSGTTQSPAYATRQNFRPGDEVPLILGGTEIARLPVASLL
jgi:Uma2 family endonuclease